MIPTKIKVGPYTVKVRVDSDQTSNDGCYGKFFEKSLTIYLDNQVDDTAIKETLMHEALHACFFASGLDAFLKDKENEEVIVKVLSTWVFQMLRENNKLVKYVCE